jgi:predicted metal-dependent peptidase
MLDESGRSLLSQSLGTIEQLSQSSVKDITYISCDTKVTAVISHKELINKIDNKELDMLGCGGSDFEPAFELIAQQTRNQQALLCVFTDGEIIVPDINPLPRCRTVWFTNAHESAPTNAWGEHFRL